MDIVAMRYATGLFDLAKEENSIEKYDEDLKVVEEVLSDQEIRAFFNHYKVAKADKFKVLDDAFKSQISEYVLNFLKLLIDKGRFSSVMDMISAYHTLTNDYLGVKTGTLYTSRALSDASIKEIQDAVSKSMNAKVILSVVIDESLIGGIKVVVGTHVIDGSIKNKLSLLKSELLRK